VNDQSQFDASESDEFEDDPKHISILRHVVFVNNLMCLCSSSIWISLLSYDILLRSLRCLIFILSKPIPLSKVIANYYDRIPLSNFHTRRVGRRHSGLFIPKFNPGHL